MATTLFERLKSVIFPINRQLLNLKITYFLYLSYWLVQYMYGTLIFTQLISYKQLAIIYACSPIFAIPAPLITGFIGDKIGNYKVILMALSVLGGVVFLPLLWLQTIHKTDPDSGYIFPVSFIIIILAVFLFDSSVSMLDACSLSISKKHGADFGRQKMWSIAGTATVPFACGYIIDLISEYKGFKDYSVIFYITTGISVAVLPLMYQLDVQIEKNQHTLLKTARKVIGMVDVDIFLVMEAVVGLSLNWHRSFFLVYAHTELEASKTLFGGALFVGGVSTMITFWLSRLIVGKLGAPSTVSASLLVASIRCILYYFLRNPWIILGIEILEGFTGYLGGIAGNYFCAAAAPPGMLASMNGLLTAAYFGAGRGIGLVAASLVISAYGIRFAYLALGILTFSTATLYMIVYHIFLKKLELKRFSKSKQEEIAMKTEETLF